MKKILCYFFTFLILFTLCVPISAASFEDLAPLDMDNTSIEYDFENVFKGDYKLSQYRENSLDDNIKFITMAEKGYGKSQNLAYVGTPYKSYQYAKYEKINDNDFYLIPTNKTTSSSKYVHFKYQVKRNTYYRVKANLTRIGNFNGNSQVLCFRDGNMYISGTSNSVNTEKHNYNMVVNSGDSDTLTVGFNIMSNVVICEENDIKLLVEDFSITEGKDDLPYEPHNISKDYGLYFYFYNPSRQKIIKDSDLNQIKISSNINRLGDHFNKYQISLVDTYNATEDTDTTTNALILKYKLQNYDDFIYSETMKARSYDIAEVELLLDGGINAKAFRVASEYTFAEINGYTSASYTNTEVVRIEKENLEFAYYRTPDEGSVDNYHDLHTVFFTVPKEIREKYGELVEVSAVWEECFTQPILLTDNEDIQASFEEILGQEVPTDFPYSFGYDYYITDYAGTALGMRYYGKYCYLFNTNINLSHKVHENRLFEHFFIESGNYYDNLIDKIYFVKQHEDVFSNSVIISSNEMIDIMNEYKWDDKVFTNIDQSNYKEPVRFNTARDKNFTYFRNPNFWEKLAGLNNKLVNEIPYSNLEKVDTNIIRKEALFCRDYFISSKDDYNDIKFMYAENVLKGRTDLYALHFTVTPYITHQAFFYDSDGKKVDTDSLVAQATAIRNFDFIDLTYNKNGVITVLGVVGSPQNTIPDITGNENYADPIQDLWKEILELLERILPILVILILIAIILKIYQIFKRPKVIIKEERKRKE